MKREIENIDKIFIEGIDGLYNEIPLKASWRKVRGRLLLKQFNSAKLIFPIALTTIFVVAPFFIFFLNPVSNDNQLPIVEDPYSVNIIKEISAPSTSASISLMEMKELETVPSNSITHLNTTLILNGSSDQKLTFAEMNSQFPAETKGIDYNSRTSNKITHVTSKQWSSNTIAYQGNNSVNTILQDTSQKKFMMPVPKKRSTDLYLGLSVGTDITLNNSNTARIPSSIYFAGLSLKYETDKFYLLSSLNFSYFESNNKYNYFYDTLAGQLVSSGYEIIPVVDNQGDTAWSKVYNDTFTNVYDTVVSDDQINMTSYQTVVSIPISIGKKLFEYKRFNASLFGGATFSILFNKEQSIPTYSGNNQEIIKIDKNSSNDVYSQCYVHGGIMLGYRVSNATNIAFSTAYNYSFTVNHSGNQSFPVSFLNVKFGILFKL